MENFSALHIHAMKQLQRNAKSLNDILFGTSQIVVMEVLESLLASQHIDRSINGAVYEYFIVKKGEDYLKQEDDAKIAKEKASAAKSIALPRTFTYLNEVYVPPKDTSCRNQGNKHIPSRGLG